MKGTKLSNKNTAALSGEKAGVPVMSVAMKALASGASSATWFENRLSSETLTAVSLDPPLPAATPFRPAPFAACVMMESVPIPESIARPLNIAPPWPVAAASMISFITVAFRGFRGFRGFMGFIGFRRLGVP